MPNVTVTPAQLAWSGLGVVIEPIRVDITAAVAAWTGGFVSVGPGLGSTVTTPVLNRLKRQVSYYNETGEPTTQMQTFWQRQAEAIEGAFVTISGQLAEIQAAQALASAASDSAAAVNARASLESSYTNPPSVLTAANDGTVTIAAHDRIYTDGATVAVGAGSVSGFAYGDTVVVHYGDAAREGGAVTYTGSTAPVAQTGNTHVVGAATIPASGAPASAGTGVTAPGYTPDTYAAAVSEYYSGY
mgnify:CR=1 FL=1